MKKPVRTPVQNNSPSEENVQSSEEMRKLAREIKHIREDVLRLSQEQFAQCLGMHRRTVQEWEYGRNVPMGTTLSFLRHLEACETAREQFKKIVQCPQ